MTLSEEVKDRIKAEYEAFKERMYAGKSKEERQEMGQFFTPPEITMRMLEKFDKAEGTICDPTMGAGNLLVGAYLAGFKMENIYGVELDPTIMEVAKDRLTKLGFPVSYFERGKDNHFWVGDALEELSFDFPLHKGKIGKWMS